MWHREIIQARRQHGIGLLELNFVFYNVEEILQWVDSSKRRNDAKIHTFLNEIETFIQ